MNANILLTDVLAHTTLNAFVLMTHDGHVILIHGHAHVQRQMLHRFPSFKDLFACLANSLYLILCYS